MPDTSIYEDDPLKLAEEKARTMGLNSFTLWNAHEAALFVKSENDEYVEVKHWTIDEINSREDVDRFTYRWKETLHTIIDTINTLLNGNSIRSINPIDVINTATYEKFIADLTPCVKNAILKKSRKDKMFEEEMNDWWNTSQADYPDKNDKESTLAGMVIVNWMNRFIFAHYLKKYFDIARKVDTITPDIDVKDAITIFEEMSSICDFYNILSSSFADDCIDEYCWRSLNELNRFLCNVCIENISQESLHALLKNVITFSKRESAGQFCTPPLLARLLVELSMKNAEGTLIDPCCGTGTIAKEALIVKHSRGVNEPHKTVWASDKFPYPLSLASISLANPDNVQEPVQVFKEDVFKLESGMTVYLTDPKTGSKIPFVLQKFDTVVSNLPFVRFEKAEGANPNIRKLYLSDKRSDLYAYIALDLKRIVSKEGRVGIIISNSWLGVDWAKDFRNQLLENFEVEFVVISQSGRWFKDVDVVTTILVLKNRSKKASDNEIIRFVSIAERIENWENENLFKSIVTDIWLNKTESEHVYIHNHSIKEIKEAYSIGFGPIICFTEMKWISKIANKMVPVSNYYDIKRGSRRGQNEFFYPKNTDQIEKDYLKPFLKSSKSVETPMAKPDGIAFCCEDSIETLTKKGMTGVLSWIKKFANRKNGKGELLVDVLSSGQLEWYQMRASEIADLGLSLNPNNKLFVFRFEERTFVDQRIIRLTKINDAIDIELHHALLNSTLGLLMIESQGFGRGLGVLDLNVSKMRASYSILNPDLLSSDQIMAIKEAFKPTLSRKCEEVPEELVKEDRKHFDEVVLSAYGLTDLQETISNALLELYHLRKAVEVDKKGKKQIG